MELLDAYKAMINSVKRTWDGMSAELGMTTSALRNRVYGVKGQALSVNDSLEMQTISGRTDFAEAIAQASGGTFVKLPTVEDVCNVSLLSKFNELHAELGTLSARFAEYTKDDELNDRECTNLKAIGDEIHKTMEELLALTFKIYRKEKVTA